MFSHEPFAQRLDASFKASPILPLAMRMSSSPPLAAGLGRASMKCCALLILLALTACSGDGSTGASGSATVIIGGAPLSSMLVGNTVQLSATPVNASGGVVSNLAIEWKTSNAAVAVVSPIGLVTAAGPGVATITAASGRSEGKAQIDVRAGGTVTTTGATISMLEGAATLIVPAFALSQSTIVMMGYAPTIPMHARLVAGTAYEVGPDGLSLSRAASLSVRYDPSKIPSGTTEASLQLYTVVGGAWALVRASTVNVATHTVTGIVWHSGVFAVMSTPVDHMTVSDAQANVSLFVGQTGQLTATLYDADNTVLTGRAVSWSTSDASKISVDQSGKVSALAVGAATITAATDGKNAVSTLTVLSRVTPDWSAATEWTTYQGNASHSGYVPVTVDAGAFKELWTTAIGSAALNPVTAGDGRVYVSTNAYFGTQIATALDVHTGVVLWSRDFGPIHSIDPPAFDNGTVYLQTGGHEDSFFWGLDAATGSLRFRTPYGNQWGRWYAPTIVGSTAYVAGGYYGGMYAFRTSDGSQQWSVGLNQYDQLAPVVAGGSVYAYTGLYAPKLSVVGASDGKVVYEVADPTFDWTGWSMDQSPVLGSMSDILATNGGRLLSFDIRTHAIGYEIKTAITGQVSVGNGLVFVRSGKSVEARKESDGSLVWVWTPPEGQPTGTMIVTKNLLFVSTSATTYAVDLSSQRQVWTYPAGGSLALSGQGILFIAGWGSAKLTAISVR